MKNPFFPGIPETTFQDWLHQFRESEIPIILKLVEAFRFYDTNLVMSKLRDLHKQILLETGVNLESTYFVPVGYAAKSGSVVTYFYKIANEIDQSRIITSADAGKIKPEPGTKIIFLDDYIGSGHQSRQVWDGIKSLNPTLIRDCTLIFACIVAKQHGIDHVKRHTGFKVLAVDVLTEVDQPFSESSTVFEDPSERDRARDILAEYGSRLYPGSPLGYESTQGLLGMFYSTPNNTLPIFWSSEAGWKPLLAHKESFRDPGALFGPPSGLPNSGLSASQPWKSAALSPHNLEIDPDTAARIFTEFRRNDVYNVLAPIVVELGMNHAAFLRLTKMITSLRNLKHEQEAVSTTVLIAPENLPSDALGEGFLRMTQDVFADSSEHVEAICKLIPGDVGGIVVSPDMKVLKSVVFKDPGEPTNYSMIPIAQHRVARATLDTRGLAFNFSGEGYVSVFYCGKKILIYRGAGWHVQPSDLESGLDIIGGRAGIQPAALRRVFRLASELSSRGKGGLLTIGAHEEVLRLAEPPRSEFFAWNILKGGKTSVEAILGIMSQDGATIFDSLGSVVQTMTFLRPPPDATGAVEIGRGSKHSTASNITAATGCISIAISVDGRITSYYRGEILLKLMG